MKSMNTRYMGSNARRPAGFTIVELLIVITIVAILSVIVIVAYNGFTQKAASSVIENDLRDAAKQLEIAKTTSQNNQYPTTLSSAGIQPGGATTFQYSRDTTRNSFCLTAASSHLSTAYRITAAGLLTKSPCAGHSNENPVPPLAKPVWTATQLNTLLTIPVATTMDGKPIAVSVSLTSGISTGTHIDGNTWFGYTIDGVAAATAPTPDMRLNAGLTMTVSADIAPNDYDSFNIYVGDSEYNSFVVYAENGGGQRLPTQDWLVLSQEYVGTRPASHPNPHTINPTSISFAAAGIGVQNDDAMEISIDRDTLSQAERVVIEFTSVQTGDWTQWALMGRARQP